MRRATLLALAVLPLLGFDCGGDPAPALPAACTLSVAGAAGEDLWCIVTVYDYSRPDPASTMYVFELVAYRSMSEVGAGVGFFLPTRALVQTASGWDSSTGATTVDSGSASRSGGALAETHRALAPLGDLGTGKLTAVFTALPAPGAPDAQMINVHGTLTATLPSITAGAPVTLSATF